MANPLGVIDLSHATPDGELPDGWSDRSDLAADSYVIADLDTLAAELETAYRLAELAE